MLLDLRLSHGECQFSRSGGFEDELPCMTTGLSLPGLILLFFRLEQDQCGF
jgi:hypothetical protein